MDKKNLAEQLRGRTISVQQAKHADERRRTAEEHQENLRKARAALPQMADALKRAAHESAAQGERVTHVSLCGNDTKEFLTILLRWAKRQGLRGRRKYIDHGTNLAGESDGGDWVFEIKW